MQNSTICDKCGKQVPENNDVVRFDFLLSGEFGLMFAQSRHLLPTDDCPGSPSRAQYIKGQPKDPRYPYNPTREDAYRAAYAKLIEDTN